MQVMSSSLLPPQGTERIVCRLEDLLVSCCLWLEGTGTRAIAAFEAATLMRERRWKRRWRVQSGARARASA